MNSDSAYYYWPLKNELIEEFKYIEEAFSDDECKKIIELGKKIGLIESKTSDGQAFSEVRKSKNCWISPTDDSIWLFQKVQKHVEEINKFFNFDLHSMEYFQFTEYDEEYSGYYGPHLDKYTKPPIPDTHRKLSFSIQLSDDDDYVGGNLLIYMEKNPFVANRKRGCINFFPSYTLHQVTPVTKGRRYALVGWASGPKLR
jgi:PKHD-type hydroxylase